MDRLLWVGGVDDGANQPEQLVVSDLVNDLLIEDFVVDAGEVFADIGLECKAVFAAKRRKPIHRPMGAFVGAAGIGIVDEGFFKERLNDVA